ncbi:MAG TPA: PH domain-containing protein [Chloroflexi bacterium]|nr:PH domain-containing protein [Chloroflexota bacterium]
MTLGMVSAATSGSVLVIGITFLMTALWAWMWFGTAYTIAGDELIVRCGPFRRVVELNEIVSVRKTHNPLASFALSLDRLEIRYGEQGLVLISPRDEVGFIDRLRGANPVIRVG